jgi:hypothetical protein
MYIPKYFATHELVPQETFERWGERSLMFMDSRILENADKLRERYGSITINNWFWGGDRQWSGLRTESTPYGSQYSQHRFGRALDHIFADVTAEEVRQDILQHPEQFSLVTSIELNTGWLHADCRNVYRIQTY